jgi:hypothetical protein
MSLYKYVIPDRIDILENSLIRLTQPFVFNDPFECFPYIKEVAHDERVSEYLNKHQCREEEKEKMLLESWEEERERHPELNVPYEAFREFLAFKMDQSRPFIYKLVKGLASMDDPCFRSETVHALTRAMNREIGILCLTEKMDNLLMWAHYASNHTGFVIALNEKHSFFDRGSEIGHLKKVRYSITRPEVTLLDPTLSDMEHIYQWINDIFCIKSEHWDYEQEWRMIVALRNCQNVIASQQDDICLFELPKSCITGIILGCRMSTEHKEAILNVLRNDDEYRHVSIRQAEMDEKEFRLRFIELRP